jgi:AAA+ ATPase superfamily predicted ATPase
MVKFFNREREMAELDAFLEREEAQLVGVYGRRRVGKTTLLTTWAARTGLPVLYWVAKHDPKQALMVSLARTIWAWEHGGEPGEIGIQPRNWEDVFQMMARAIGNRRVIVILDELPYALQQDRGFASHIQAAWDHLFKDSSILLFLSGSHIGMMVDLLTYQAPLYGRFTAQLPLLPLSFPDIRDFLPRYDVYKRLAVYAILGGIPAYLERWDDGETIAANVQRLFLQRTGWFRNEPLVLISDLTRRESTSFEAILRALAAGNHTREDIAAASAITSPSLSHYLPRLIELNLVERRIPATVPLKQRRTSRLSRYYLSDPYLRFYHRFIDPNLHLIEQGLTSRLWQMMEDNFRAFVALTFEELCRVWTLAQAQVNRLPFTPDVVGSHWATDVQVDVVAIAWREKCILLAECKWGVEDVGCSVVRELVEEKTPRVLAALSDGGEGWAVHYALFARTGFTEAAKAEAAQHNAILVNLATLDRDLRQADQSRSEKGKGD